MKKLLLSAFMLLSVTNVFVSAGDNPDDYMNRYSSPEQRNYLISAPFIAEYNAGLKAMYLAKAEAHYDMGWTGYLKSYFFETAEGNTLRAISQVESQIQEQLNVLKNNTWKQWGWSATKYATVILATIAIVKYTDILNTAKPVEVIVESALEAAVQ